MEYAVNPADGVRIAYATTGTGPPRLLVHGSVLTHQIWRTFGYVRALSPHRRLVLVDQRGHGRSDAPTDPADYAMDRVTGDLLAVLDALAIERTDYLGYSFGGRTGLHLVARAPERIGSMMLGGAGPAAQKGELDRLFFPECADVIADDGMAAFVHRWEAHRGYPVDSGTRAAFVRNDSAAMAAYFRACDLDPGVPDETMAAVTAPVQYFVGSEDATRIDDVIRAAALTPDSRLEVLDGYDHATAVAGPDAVELACRVFTT